MDVQETADKIRSMQIRGALDIGLAAADSLLRQIKAGKTLKDLEASGEILRAARPTAVSLPNSIDYVLNAYANSKDGEEAAVKVEEFIESQNQAMKRIGEYGSHLIKDGDTLLTICNSDTAINVFRHAHQDGKNFRVYACETRPRNQGYLTSKAIRDIGIPTTLIVDSAAHHVMREKGVNHVFVGADSVYTNGNVVNKIGTSQVALIAQANEIDFNVCTQTIKFSPQSLYGVESEIEERDTSEVADIEGIDIYNPAFDVTPKEHVTRIITEDGVIPPEAAYNIVKEKFGWRLK